MKQGKVREGTLLQLNTRRMSKSDILTFAAAFDPQPAHLDERAAQDTPLRGLSASGWHTCAVIAGALEEALESLPGYVGITGVDDLRWLKPVRPEDQLIGCVILGPPSACTCGNMEERRPAQVEVRNQRGVEVVRWSCHVLLGRRSASATISVCAARAARRSGVDRRSGVHFIKYFEDIHRGDEIELGGYEFTPESQNIFDSIVTSCCSEAYRPGVRDWHLVAGWMKLITAYYDDRAAQLASVNLPAPRLGPAIGLRWLRWLASVSTGERITFRSWVEHKVDAAGTSQWGLLIAGTEGFNARGEIVISFYPQFILERRTIPGAS